jgi:hypothetical protein
MPTFMEAEWHPPDDLNEFDSCDFCNAPTRDLVYVRGREMLLAICTGCAEALVKFTRQVADHCLRLDEQYWQSTR